LEEKELGTMKKLILAIALTVGLALAQGPGGGVGRGAAGFGPGGGGGNLDAAKSALGLTDAQISQLKELRTAQFEAMRPTMEQARAKQQELRQLMQSSNPDSAAVGKLMVETKALREQVKQARNDREAKALAILTPDQKTKLQTLQEAQKLMPAVREATALGLLDVPEPGAGAMARARQMQRGAGARKAARTPRNL
jgi:periplasmic protein CpxP/Spy